MGFYLHNLSYTRRWYHEEKGYVDFNAFILNHFINYYLIGLNYKIRHPTTYVIERLHNKVSKTFEVDTQNTHIEYFLFIV